MNRRFRLKEAYKKLNINTKYTLLLTGIVIIILSVNVFLFININSTIDRIDNIYDSNVALNELSENIDKVSESLTEYLNTKSTESMENYYRYEQELKEKNDYLNNVPTGNSVKLSEKNIRNLIDAYLENTDMALEAKRGRNIEKYKNYYDKANELKGYIAVFITDLNNEQFKSNVVNYKDMQSSLKTIEFLCFIIFAIVAVMGIVLVSIISNSITIPLRNLVNAAMQISSGNYDIEIGNVSSNDEVGIVSQAFNTMTEGIKSNIIKLRENMENERRMKEKELLMESHLKDARLKYLQAQINPHFLFNTMNAGAQLAMLEGADRTYEYVQQVANFFRYNIKKDNDVVNLAEEIAMVDTYIYILNVRFSGEIGYEKDIDERLLNIKVPSMCLQPVVENAVNYGIRNIDYKGIISLSVYEDENNVIVSIKDNGVGMKKQVIEEIINKTFVSNEEEEASNGIGLNNVMTRLQLLYGENDILSIYSEGENLGTEVIFRLPKNGIED